MKKIIKIFLIMLTLSFVACLPDPAVSADPAAKPQYPGTIQDEKAFQSVAKSFHRVPYNDPKLEFDILLPKDWTAVSSTPTTSPLNSSQKIIGEIARFKSPVTTTSQAQVVIMLAQLGREISAENWLKNYVLVNSYTLQSKVTPLSEKKATATYIAAQEDKSLYVHASAQISQDFIMIARFESPVPLKEPLAFLRKRIIDSFRMILPIDEPIEVQRSFTLTDAIKFSYPESWILDYPDLRDPRSPSIQIRYENLRKQTQGLVFFQAVKRGGQTTLQKEVAKLKKSFEKSWKLEFKKLLFSGETPAEDRFIFTRYETYQVGYKKQGAADQEMRFVMLGDKEWYIFLFLITPAASDDFSTWASNTQTFDLIVRTLK